MNNICIVRSPESEEREQGSERIFEEIMAENFLNLMRDVNINIKETQQTPRKVNSKRPTQRHFRIKLLKDKDKERLLKSAREK